MKKYAGRHFFIILVGLISFSCATITVNIYFPAEAVEKAAEEILTEIEGEDAALDESESGMEIETEIENGELQSYFWHNFYNFALNSSVAYGDDIDLDLTTPTIRKLIKSMKIRNSQIKMFKDKGVVGENFDGKLMIRDLSSLTGNEIRSVKKLLRAENSDRSTLYGELAKANKISESEVERIGRIFAKTRKSKLLKSGQWYRNENGDWLKVN